ncbi:MAG: hypothetical protein LIP01_04005 [Tannerellaceae bacterium]|nr:hypothetical protein [Tannerellaceae bacterium]
MKRNFFTMHIQKVCIALALLTTVFGCSDDETVSGGENENEEKELFAGSDINAYVSLQTDVETKKQLWRY